MCACSYLLVKLYTLYLFTYVPSDNLIFSVLLYKAKYGVSASFNFFLMLPSAKLTRSVPLCEVQGSFLEANKYVHADG